MNHHANPGPVGSLLSVRRAGRRGVRAAARLLVGVAAGVVIAGCASSAASTSATATGTATPAACAETAPAGLPADRWEPARARLAPRGAVAIRLCRYSGLNAYPPLALVRSRLITDRAPVDRLVGELDRLPGARGAVGCRSDDGSQIVAMLAYDDEHRVAVRVGLSGCELVTNASVHRIALGMGSPPAFGPQLVAQLKRLTSPRRQSGPGSATALVHGRWSALARSPLGVRYGPAVVWDGRELLEVGGSAGARQAVQPQDGSAAYDPARRQWQRIASVPAAVLPSNTAAVWTGRLVFVFGQAATHAGLYDPMTNRWTVTAPAPVGPFADQPTAVWTGTRVIVAGFARAGRQQLQLASYDPATGAWSRLHPPIPTSHPPIDDAIVATNHGVLLWSMWGRMKQTGTNTYTGYSGIDVFRLDPAGVWTNITARWPQHHTVNSPIFTGSAILVAPGQVWCGACSHPAPAGDYEHSYLVNPQTLQITPLPHGPLDNIGPQVLWTGDAEIALNTAGVIGGPDNVRPGDIAIYDPRTCTWHRGPRAPAQLDVSPAVWSGHWLYALADNGRLLAYGR